MESFFYFIETFSYEYVSYIEVVFQRGSLPVRFSSCQIVLLQGCFLLKCKYSQVIANFCLSGSRGFFQLLWCIYRFVIFIKFFCYLYTFTNWFRSWFSFLVRLKTFTSFAPCKGRAQHDPRKERNR